MPKRLCLMLLIFAFCLGLPAKSSAEIADEPNLAELLSLFPALLGYERPMSYLVMLQLSDELRPSGGFMKFLVYLRMEDGEIIDLQTIETGRAEIAGLGAWDWVDGNERILPPQPIQDYLGLGNWVIRDANWWLDFRDSARQVQSFWQAAGFPAVDAVIAINDIAILNIIDSLGGLELASEGLLSGEALEAYLLEQFYSNLNDPQLTANQQGLAQELSSQLLATLLDVPMSRYPLVFAAGLEQARRNNIMLYFNDAELAETFHGFGYDGALRAEGVSDYVYLADSNVSYSKLSQMIGYSMSYEASITNELRLHSSLALRMENHYLPENRRSGFPAEYYQGARWNYETASFYRSEGYYGGYTRFAIPQTAENIAFSGFDADAGFSQRLTDLNVLGGYNALERGEAQDLFLSWEQAQVNLSAENTLTFYIQRQPGIPVIALNFRLNFPACWLLLESSENPDEQGAGFLAWSGSVESDTYYELQFERIGSC